MIGAFNRVKSTGVEWIISIGSRPFHDADQTFLTNVNATSQLGFHAFFEERVSRNDSAQNFTTTPKGHATSADSKSRENWRTGHLAYPVRSDGKQTRAAKGEDCRRCGELPHYSKTDGAGGNAPADFSRAVQCLSIAKSVDHYDALLSRESLCASADRGLYHTI